MNDPSFHDPDFDSPDPEASDLDSPDLGGSGLSTALRDRVSGVRPDLERLIATSTRAGARIRLRRQAGVSIAAAASVAAIAVAGVYLAGSGDPNPVNGGFAAEPTAGGLATTTPTPTGAAVPALTAGARLTTPGGTSVKVVLARQFKGVVVAGRSSRTPEFVLILAGPFDIADVNWLKDSFPGQLIGAGLDPISGALTDPSAAQQLPVHVNTSLTGWTIGKAADDKFPASTGRFGLTVVVRPLSELGAWSGGDPDRPHSQVAHVGANYFVTIQPGPGVPAKVVAEFKAALRYDANWDRTAQASTPYPSTIPATQYPTAAPATPYPTSTPARAAR